MKFGGDLRGRSGLVRSVTFVAAGAAAAGLFASAASASGVPNKKKPLPSMSVVSVASGTTGAAFPLWIATQEGFFTQQRLTVNRIAAPSSAADTIAILLAGTAQFDIASSSTDLLSVQAGGPIRALMCTQVDQPQELVINAATAASHGIPANPKDTAAGAIAQFKALKGSHLTFGVSNLSSEGYNWMISMGKALGISEGPGADFNLVSLGSTTAESAGLSAGKVDGILGVAPTTTAVSVATLPVEINLIPPATKACGDYLMTPISLVQQHADTVQAFVTAMVEAEHFAHIHRARALADVGVFERQNLITDQTQINDLYARSSKFWTQPYPEKSTFINEVNLTNGAQPTQLTLAYTVFAVGRFVTAAEKALHVKFPPG